MKTKIVHVHAFEYVNVSLGYPRRHIDAGGGGFEFYTDGLKASAAFKKGKAQALQESPHNVADFLFEFSVTRHATVRAITKAIDAELIEQTATAKIRRVGANVLTYWKRNKFKMGGAQRPARAL